MWRYTAPTMFFLGVILEIIGTILISQPNYFITHPKENYTNKGLTLIIAGLFLMALAFYIQNFIEYNLGEVFIKSEEIGFY